MAPLSQVRIIERLKSVERRRKGKPGIQDLIAFGNQARKGQFPYVASLLKNTSSGPGFFHSCGASLIASNLLLTAAHCFYDIPNGQWNPPTYALLGGVDLSSANNFREMIRITNFLYPSSYSTNGFDTSGGDIGIAVLETPSKMPAVKLAPANPPVGAPLTAVGWGVDENFPASNKSSPVLKYTTLTISSNACPNPPKGVLCGVGAPSKPGGAFSGTCSGDSGGPQILTNGLQVSLTSYGPAVDCGEGTWGVYTSVADYFTNFIKPAMDKYPEPSGRTSPPPLGGGDDNTFGDDAEETDGGGTSGRCATFKWSISENVKVLGGTPVGLPARVPTVQACINKCADTWGCYSFNFLKNSRRCTLYSDQQSGATTAADMKYTAGYITCNAQGGRRRQSRRQLLKEA